MKTKSLIILCLVLNTSIVEAQKVMFVKENVVFNLDSSHFTVNCELYFKNNTTNSFTQAIFFPFSCESHVVKVDTVTIFDATRNESIKPARKNMAGVLFQVNFSSQEQKKIKVAYSQDHDGKLVGFVVSKIKYWNGPLSQAYYTLNVTSASIKVDSTSFKPEKIIEEEGKTIYSWKKYNFKPEKELCIHFHVK